MNKNQIKGKARELVGKAQAKAGKLLGSKKQQAKGLAKQVAGKTQNKGGEVEQWIENSQ